MTSGVQGVGHVGELEAAPLEGIGDATGIVVDGAGIASRDPEHTTSTLRRATLCFHLGSRFDHHVGVGAAHAK